MSGNDARRTQRKRREADEARVAIMEAAASVFAKKGYYGATIDDIAHEAGYSPAALYKYFANKEDLFRHLWNRMADQIQLIFTETNALAAPFETRLRWLLSRLVALLERAPNMLIAFVAQRPYVASNIQSQLERQAYDHYRRHVAELSKIMDVGIQDGTLRPGEPEDYALMFIALLYEYAYKWVTADRPMQVEAYLEKVLELFFHGAGSAQVARAAPAPR